MYRSNKHLFSRDAQARVEYPARSGQGDQKYFSVLLLVRVRTPRYSMTGAVHYTPVCTTVTYEYAKSTPSLHAACLESEGHRKGALKAGLELGVFTAASRGSLITYSGHHAILFEGYVCTAGYQYRTDA